MPKRAAFSGISRKPKPPLPHYPEAEERIRRRWQKSSDRISGLTTRILAVNVIALMILGVGILYLGQYTEKLIEAELASLRAEAHFTAGAVLEGAMRSVEFQNPYDPGALALEVKAINPSLARSMVRTLGTISDSRIKLYNIEGSILADSHKLIGPGGVVEMEPLSPKTDQLSIGGLFSQSAIRFLDLIPMQTTLPTYPDQALKGDAGFIFEDAARAFAGEISATAWLDDQKNFKLTAAAPVQNVKQVLGLVLLVSDAKELKHSIDEVRVDVFRVFLGSLGVTVILSIYLSGLITRPLQKLAAAAEAVRLGKGRKVEIPDMSGRHDEIGELSLILREMTQAIWDRMDSIESFAADVSHEIKNPLTSLRSAVETAAHIKDEKARAKLMNIIQHDVQRLDRLITDISSASRLDAELSREEMDVVHLNNLLQQLCDAYKQPLLRVQDDCTNKTQDKLILDIPDNIKIMVTGNADRLSQVFGNLINNALSFSPENQPVHIRVIESGDSIITAIEDHGPGIPENKLDTIFERFYTQRPNHENYGSHSGLGLSISKQIIEAHNGSIWAENILNKDAEIKGARFTVILNKADTA